MDNIDWNGPITIIITGLVSIMVEYLRRKMPPERRDRRADDVVHEEEEYTDDYNV